MKNYQISLSTLGFKRKQHLGLAGTNDCSEWLYYLNCEKYLDAFAFLYELKVGKLQNEDIYPVLPDEYFMELCIDSDIIMYDMHLVNVPRDMPYPDIDEKVASEGDKIGTVRFFQNGKAYECDVVIAYCYYHEALKEHINLASMRYVLQEDILEDLRERFDFRLLQTDEKKDFAVMIDEKSSKLHFYKIPSETLDYMKNKKMNHDEMKEYLLENREWLKVNHDVSPSEEIANFFSSKAFTEE